MAIHVMGWMSQHPANFRAAYWRLVSRDASGLVLPTVLILAFAVKISPVTVTVESGQEVPAAQIESLSLAIPPYREQLFWGVLSFSPYCRCAGLLAAQCRLPSKTTVNVQEIPQDRMCGYYKVYLACFAGVLSRIFLEKYWLTTDTITEFEVVLPNREVNAVTLFGSRSSNDHKATQLGNCIMGFLYGPTGTIRLSTGPLSQCPPIHHPLRVDRRNYRQVWRKDAISRSGALLAAAAIKDSQDLKNAKPYVGHALFGTPLERIYGGDSGRLREIRRQ
ncbi:hypothetical protein BJV78DRAFT_1153173 [Lactifluus subvellereus]|nr:hypothetical protein BJV78DRAFT_1153173 [Lactifluus subvellereus]